MRDFRKLIVWQKAHALSVDAHRALLSRRSAGTATSRNQLLRAVGSIPANISEGCGKRSDAEFARYLDIALGSAKETENHLLFAHDMGWLDNATFTLFDERLTEIRRMLFSLCRVMRLRGESSTHREAGEQGAGSEEAGSDEQ
ncbi:MAG: four helix bundle protein [Gemmatimonadaceae bacterium]|nr:four helix bundle protein [Gemmatimonadaceae bacterium]